MLLEKVIRDDLRIKRERERPDWSEGTLAEDRREETLWLAFLSFFLRF
jgi:hypothetical protein